MPVNRRCRSGLKQSLHLRVRGGSWINLVLDDYERSPLSRRGRAL